MHGVATLNKGRHKSTSKGWWLASPVTLPLILISPLKDCPILVNSDGSLYRFSPGHLLPYKWESCYTIQQHSWGYDRTEQTDMFYNTTELLYQLVSTVSCNGNLLLNVGPTADGRILPSFEQRLLEMGEWLEVS